mmetsp:Transcript_18296/g.49182  ORF Transcript_18296/g.49182 Transcript_18296/m.49182 type:complete len:563 (-) Transcript_18296:183-1871(-)
MADPLALDDSFDESGDALGIGDDLGLEDGALEDDLTSLISFENLEHVVKHIIDKFKSLESRSEDSGKQIDTLKVGIDSCATIIALGEVAAELGVRVDEVNKTVLSQRETIAALENMLDRHKVLSNTIDKKLEAVVKEKGVQDRLIRETQDSLQDKVAVMELNMFEARFAGYTTKLEHQELLNKLADYAHMDVAERLADNVKVLANQFNDYTRTARIEQQLQEMRDWVNSELQHYAKAVKTNERFEELNYNIKDTTLCFDRTCNNLDDKIRKLSLRMTSVFQELNDDIAQRALHTHVLEIQANLNKYALKAELESFTEDCSPKVQFCMDSIQEFGSRLKLQDGAIQRVDEVLLDKASKYDIVVLNKSIERCYEKEKAVTDFRSMAERLDRMHKRIEDYIDAEHDRFEHFRPPDYGPVIKDLNARVVLKADKADLVEIYQVKANRADADELAQLQDTIHRQLEYLAVTTFSLSKLSLAEAKPSESKTLRTQQKSQVIMQTEALWHWVLHNEQPPGLDTLRHPEGGARRRGFSHGRGADAADVDQKRGLDDQKRIQLESKLGLHT